MSSIRRLQKFVDEGDERVVERLPDVWVGLWLSAHRISTLQAAGRVHDGLGLTLHAAVFSCSIIVVLYPVAQVEGEVCLLVRLDAVFYHRRRHSRTRYNMAAAKSKTELSRAMAAEQESCEECCLSGVPWSMSGASPVWVETLRLPASRR